MKTKQRIKRGLLPFIFAMLLLLAAPGCEQPYDGGDPALAPESPVDFTASLPVNHLLLEMENAATKVNVADDTGFCTWNDPKGVMKDTVAIWLSNESNPSDAGANRYVSSVISDRSTVEKWVGAVELNVSDGQKREFYAVYPASAAVSSHAGQGGTVPRVTYGTRYDLSSMSAVAQANRLDSLREYSRMPMVAVNDALSNTLTFCHVGGLLRIHVTNAPSGTNQVEVTFLGMEHVTGVYEVLDGPGSQSARTSQSPVQGTGNVVTFIVPSLGGETWVNVPLPSGDYGALRGVQVKVSGGGDKTQIRPVGWPTISHSQGKMLDFDFSLPAGTLAGVELNQMKAETVWKGATFSRAAMPYDNNFLLIQGATTVWLSDMPTVADVDPSTGVVTAMGAGEAFITARVSYGGRTEEASYKVYVNEATITLKPSSLTGRAGKSSKIKADVTYTRNGDWSVPRISWSTTAPSYVTVGEASLLPDESNIVNFLAINGSSPASVKAEIIVAGNSGNPVTVAGAECVVDVISAAYVPGKFSVSPTKKVYFASGNVLFKADKSGNNWTNRRWEFAQNQWDVYTHSNNFSYEDGTDIVIDHFPWAANGVKNVNDKYHYFYQPYVFNKVYDIYTPYSEEGVDNSITIYDPNDDGGEIYLEFYPNLKITGPSVNQKGMGIIGINDVFTGEWENLFLPAFDGEFRWQDAWRCNDMINDINHNMDVMIPWSVWSGSSASFNNSYKFANWIENWEVGRYCDWGVHFEDDGTGSDSKTDGRSWYTLSAVEWDYLLRLRSRARLLHAFGTIYDSVKNDFVRGLIILPDNWETPEDCTFIPSITDFGFNIYVAGRNTEGVPTNGIWEDMEAAGAVFLPGDDVYYSFSNNYSDIVADQGSIVGAYWSSSAVNGSNYYYTCFVQFDLWNPDAFLSLDFHNHSANLNSVRLVHD